MKSSLSPFLCPMNIKIIFISLVLVACSKVPIEKWEPQDIIGFNLSLRSKHSIQSFSFSADKNLVIAKIGTEGGPVAGPVWHWEIDKNGILLIKEADGTVLYKLSKLYESDSIITVEQTDNRLLKRFFHEKLKFTKEKIRET